MKTIIFGGSFDPIHKGHIEVIKAALSHFDKVIVVPNFQNPLKNRLITPGELRFEWIKKSVSNLKRVEVSRYEIDQNSPCYSIDTVKHFTSFYDNLFFLIGSDNVETLSQWKESEALRKLVTFVVATRDGKRYKGFETLNVNAPVSSTEFRKTFKRDLLPEIVADEIIEYYTIRKQMNRLEKIKELIDDKKGLDIEIIDVKESDYFTDYVIIATTMAQKHGAAILDHLKANLKPEEEFLFAEESDEWTVIDLGDVLIHLISEEYRAKYRIESFLKEFLKKKKG